MVKNNVKWGRAKEEILHVGICFSPRCGILGGLFLGIFWLMSFYQNLINRNMFLHFFLVCFWVIISFYPQKTSTSITCNNKSDTSCHFAKKTLIRLKIYENKLKNPKLKEMIDLILFNSNWRKLNNKKKRFFCWENYFLQWNVKYIFFPHYNWPEMLYP